MNEGKNYDNIAIALKVFRNSLGNGSESQPLNSEENMGFNFEKTEPDENCQFK